MDGLNSRYAGMRAGTCAFALAVFAGAAWAQEGQPAEAPPARQVEWTVAPKTFIGFSSGFDGSPGDVTVSRIGADLSVDIPIKTMSGLELGFEYEYSRYDFSGATGFTAAPAGPFQDIHREVFRARYGQQESRQLGWFVAGYVGLSGEVGADLGESIIGGVYGGVAYYVSRELRVGGAIGVFSQLEDDVLIIPVPSIDWKISEKWRLSNAGKPGATVFYSPTEDWTLQLGAWYDARNFRLDENGPVPGGVGRESSVPIEFGVVFRPMSNLELSGTAGVRIFNNYELANSTGGILADIDADPSGYVGFGITVKF